MKFTKTNMIDKYHINLEPGDEHHEKCRWVDFILDNESFTLSIVSDWGNFSYRWGVSKSEPLKNLMVRIEEEYLLSKISDMSQLDTKATITEIQRWVSEMEKEEDRIKACDYLDRITPHTVDELVRNVEDFYGEEKIRMQWVYESIVMDYPSRAKMVAKLFTEYLQPILKEEVSL